MCVRNAEETSDASRDEGVPGQTTTYAICAARAKTKKESPNDA